MLSAQTKFILDARQVNPYLKKSGLHFILPCIIFFMSDNPFVPSLPNLGSFYQATDEFVPKYCRVWLVAQPLKTRFWISCKVCLFCHHIYARLDFIICIWHCCFFSCCPCYQNWPVFNPLRTTCLLHYKQHSNIEADLDYMLV